MNSNSTKQRIIDAAIHLFNEHGVANVRLQQIADEVGISVGNLAYHFRNKETIVTAVYEQLFEELSEILSRYLQSPALLDFETQLTSYHDFFSRYRFYLIDLFEVERFYPAIMERWQQFVLKMMLQIRKRLDYYVLRQIMVPEPLPGVYETLTNNIWQTIVFWAPQQALKGQSFTLSAFKAAVWAQIRPYLTHTGFEHLSLANHPNDLPDNFPSIP